MTDADAQDFVVRLAAVWASGNSDAFLTLWHQDCVLHTPILERPLPGRDLPRLHRAQMAATPDLVWQLLDWSWRGAVVIVEWQCSRFVAGRTFSWRGVDKFVVKDGMIVEERVYMDTAPLRAAREGRALEPMMVLAAADAAA